jgi:mevalonate pyrophosphate decarboxylase
MLCHTCHSWGHGNWIEGLKKSENNTRTELNRFSAKKKAVLGISPIIRKVLQSESRSLSGGVRHWLRRRSTRKNIKPVIREGEIMIIMAVIM